MTTATQPLRERLREAAKWLQEDCSRRERFPPNNRETIARDRDTVNDLLIACNDAMEMAAFDAWADPFVWQYRQWIDARGLAWLYAEFRRGTEPMVAAGLYHDIYINHDEWYGPERDDEPADDED